MRGPSGDREPVVIQMADDTVRSADVAPEEISRLEADPQVASVLRRGATVGPAIAASVPLVGAPALWSGGTRGAGKVIAVIDTGVSSSFGGTLVGLRGEARIVMVDDHSVDLPPADRDDRRQAYVPARSAGQRLDKFLVEHFSNFSRRQWAKSRSATSR